MGAAPDGEYPPGKTFGRLTVVELLPRRVVYKRKNRADVIMRVYQCRCVCGAPYKATQATLHQSPDHLGCKRCRSVALSDRFRKYAAERRGKAGK